MSLKQLIQSEKKITPATIALPKQAIEQIKQIIKKHTAMSYKEIDQAVDQWFLPYSIRK